jgi:hypothetical protein
MVGFGAIGYSRARTKAELKGRTFNQDYKLYTLEDAKTTKIRMNKILSPGEKSYYGLKYVVAEVVNGVFTGK